VRFDILGRRNARPRWCIYRWDALALFTKSTIHQKPFQISVLHLIVQRLAIHPPVLLPTLEWNSAIQCLRMSWWGSRSNVRFGIAVGLLREFDSQQVLQESLVDGEELMRRFEQFVGAVTQRTIAEVLYQPKV
jgi:hypothetical protein